MTDMPSMASFRVSSDRRDSARTMAIFRPGLIVTEEFKSFYCLVRNISPWGMMATIFAPVAPAQLIRLRLSETVELYGEVVWCEGDRIGVKFEEEVDVASLLTELTYASNGNGNYRAPRLEIEAQALFLAHSQPHRLTLKNISQRGLKAEAEAETVTENDRGTIVIPGLQPRTAVVRWKHGAMAGFYFIDPIGFAELGQWVLDQHSHEGDAR